MVKIVNRLKEKTDSTLSANIQVEWIHLSDVVQPTGYKNWASWLKTQGIGAEGHSSINCVLCAKKNAPVGPPIIVRRSRALIDSARSWYVIPSCLPCAKNLKSSPQVCHVDLDGRLCRNRILEGNVNKKNKFRPNITLNPAKFKVAWNRANSADKEELKKLVSYFDSNDAKVTEPISEIKNEHGF